MVEDKQIDSEPDRFYYKLADQSGSFSLGVRYLNSSKPHMPTISGFITHPYAPIQIDGWATLGSNEIDITDDKGIKYVFGSEMEGYTEMTGNFNTRWLCKQISSPCTKATISFQYTPLQNKYVPTTGLKNYMVLEADISNAYSLTNSVADSTWFPIEENTFLVDENHLGFSRSNFTPSDRYKLTIKEGSYLYNASIRNGEVLKGAPRYDDNEYKLDDPYDPYKNAAVKERRLRSIGFDGGNIWIEEDNQGNLGSMTVQSKDGTIIRHFSFFCFKVQ